MSEVLVPTDWVFDHLNDPGIRLVESNEDPLVYRSGHIPGAVEIDWVRDLNDDLRRDYLDGKQFSTLMRRCGIDVDTTVILYGDRNNWWAAYAFWVFTLFGHTKLKMMDGGRLKWLNEKRPLIKESPRFPATAYPVPVRDDRTFRAFRDEVLTHIGAQKPLIDVRSPEEYNGTRLHMDGYPNEGALRGGHIPGAKSVPWARAVNANDGTFKDEKSLRTIYEVETGIKHSDEIITYCRIGERSSHTWFVLHHLLGFPKVKNYDGSWTEWGNLVGAPIEK